MDTICAMWHAFVAGNPNVTSAYSSDFGKSEPLENRVKGSTNVDDTIHIDESPIIQSVIVQDMPNSYVGAAGGLKLMLEFPYMLQVGSSFDFHVDSWLVSVPDSSDLVEQGIFLLSKHCVMNGLCSFFYCNCSLSCLEVLSKKNLPSDSLSDSSPLQFSSCLVVSFGSNLWKRLYVRSDLVEVGIGLSVSFNILQLYTFFPFLGNALVDNVEKNLSYCYIISLYCRVSVWWT
ncbi:hypothetical protein Tco_0510840 [Tanacetum coccineum]